MSYRKSFKLICGVAGGSVALVLAAAAADSRGYFGEQRGLACRWSRFTVQAAQPAHPTPAPTGHSWDFNWDKCVFYGFSPIFPRRYQCSYSPSSNITFNDVKNDIMYTSLRINHTNFKEVSLNAPLKLTVLHLILDITFWCPGETRQR